MESAQELDRKLREISDAWERITATPDPPRSMMNVIEYGLGEKRRGEVYVTRFLRYLLDPAESHGMETAFLEAFLEGFADRFGFTEPIHDLSKVRVRNEVWIRNRNEMQHAETGEAPDDESEGDDSSGRVDIVVEKPGDWFVLIELKFSAEENNLAGTGHSQTEFYRHATHIGETPVKDYEGHGSYLYLHKAGTRSAEETAFANWTWEDWTTDVLEPFIETTGPTLPHRTLVHLTELRDDIETFTNMTPDEPHETEKVDLYLDNYTVLNDLQQSFENRWEDFTDQWNTDLAVALDEHLDTYYEADEGIVAVDLEDGAPESTWYLRAKHKDWQHLFRDGWYRPANVEQWRSGELDSLYEKATDHDTIRVFYHHRMKTNRDAAIEDNTLIFTFRNARANSRPFLDEFDAAFDARQEELMDLLPDSATWLGQKSNQFEIRYDIPEPDADNDAAPDDFFEAYIGTVRTAFVDLVVERPELTATITEIYDDALEAHMTQL